MKRELQIASSVKPVLSARKQQAQNASHNLLDPVSTVRE
jgi:hypothetical protein